MELNSATNALLCASTTHRGPRGSALSDNLSIPPIFIRENNVLFKLSLYQNWSAFVQRFDNENKTDEQFYFYNVIKDLITMDVWILLH
jgi:hypothetical protein